MLKIKEIEIYQNFFRNLKKHRIKLFLLTILMIFEGFTSSISIAMLIPLSEGILNNNSENTWLERFLPTQLIDTPFKLFLIFGFILFLKALISFLRFLFVMIFSENLRKNWQIKLATKNLLQPYSEVIKRPRGELIENTVKLTDIGAMFILKWLSYTTRLIIVASLFLTVTIFNPIFSLVVIIILSLLIIFFGKNYFNWSLSLGEKKVKYGQRLMSQLTAIISALKDIKVLRAEKYKLKSTIDLINYIRNIRVVQKIATQFPIHLLEFSLAISLILFAFILFIYNLNLSTILPTLIFLIGSLFVLVNNFVTASTERFKTLGSYYAYKFIIKELNQAYSEEDDTKINDIPNKNSDLIFSNVSFNYSGNTNNLISNINLKIKAGTIIGLFGVSGSGKTTLLDLITKLHKPSKGKILFNDLDINNFSNSDWRNKISYVTQDPILFEGNLRDNILLGRDYTDENIINVCKVADLSSFLQTKSGLETKIDDNGSNLSGGQKRRIAIARSLLNNPFILIVDEATNSLDEKSEENIFSKLRQIDHLTVIVVSHRNITKNFVDCNFHIKNGRIE